MTNETKQTAVEKAKQLIEIIERKQTNLCVATDCATENELFQLINKVGNSICLLKTHSDMITDWTIKTEEKINELKEIYDFMWLEDRKFGDIANTCLKQ